MKSMLLVILIFTCLALSARAEKPRGFDIGNTLPDIPLVDLDGVEVRFSEFLGQQYVLYGWASW